MSAQNETTRRRRPWSVIVDAGMEFSTHPSFADAEKRARRRVREIEEKKGKGVRADIAWNGFDVACVRIDALSRVWTDIKADAPLEMLNV